MAVRDLKELQKQIDALKPDEQVQLTLYLMAKTGNRLPSEEALLSESALKKDWLRPEEDKAWANL